jgi:hypothetical protein
VTIGGTLQAATIINNSQKPILGFSVERITDNGINYVFDVLSLNSAANPR